MPTTDTTTPDDLTPATPMNVTVYHNQQESFTPYQQGQPLAAVINYWLDPPVHDDPVMLAEWAFHTFNADLYLLETQRDAPRGETAFLAACVYRLLGYRSVSVGDVVEIRTGTRSHWLACDPYIWRTIPAPSHPLSGSSLTAATIYQHLTDQRTAR
jgi:hypothetical protein